MEAWGRQSPNTFYADQDYQISHSYTLPSNYFVIFENGHKLWLNLEPEQALTVYGRMEFYANGDENGSKLTGCGEVSLVYGGDSNDGRIYGSVDIIGNAYIGSNCRISFGDLGYERTDIRGSIFNRGGCGITGTVHGCIFNYSGSYLYLANRISESGETEIQTTVDAIINEGYIEGGNEEQHYGATVYNIGEDANIVAASFDTIHNLGGRLGTDASADHLYEWALTPSAGG